MHLIEVFFGQKLLYNARTRLSFSIWIIPARLGKSLPGRLILILENHLSGNFNVQKRIKGFNWQKCAIFVVTDNLGSKTLLKGFLEIICVESGRTGTAQQLTLYEFG